MVQMIPTAAVGFRVPQLTNISRHWPPGLASIAEISAQFSRMLADSRLPIWVSYETDRTDEDRCQTHGRDMPRAVARVCHQARSADSRSRGSSRKGNSIAC